MVDAFLRIVDLLGPKVMSDNIDKAFVSRLSVYWLSNHRFRPN